MTVHEVASQPIGLVSVNVAEPTVIGHRRPGAVISGIIKRPVAGPMIGLTTLNLAGDRQADLVNHGGPDKAVYVYPSEHLPAWSDELATDPAFGPGSFGENLSTTGWLEDEVRIGDTWAWGDARLQVSLPREPCYKLAMVTGRPEIIRLMVENGRTGWYLRVLRPGTVPIAGPITLLDRVAGAPTVREVHTARFGERPG